MPLPVPPEIEATTIHAHRVVAKWLPSRLGGRTTIDCRVDGLHHRAADALAGLPSVVGQCQPAQRPQPFGAQGAREYCTASVDSANATAAASVRDNAAAAAAANSEFRPAHSPLSSRRAAVRKRPRIGVEQQQLHGRQREPVAELVVDRFAASATTLVRPRRRCRAPASAPAAHRVQSNPTGGKSTSSLADRRQLNQQLFRIGDCHGVDSSSNRVGLPGCAVPTPPTELESIGKRRSPIRAGSVNSDGLLVAFNQRVDKFAAVAYSGAADPSPAPATRRSGR